MLAINGDSLVSSLLREGVLEIVQHSCPTSGLPKLLFLLHGLLDELSQRCPSPTGCILNTSLQSLDLGPVMSLSLNFSNHLGQIFAKPLPFHLLHLLSFLHGTFPAFQAFLPHFTLFCPRQNFLFNLTKHVAQALECGNEFFARPPSLQRFGMRFRDTKKESRGLDDALIFLGVGEGGFALCAFMGNDTTAGCVS